MMTKGVCAFTVAPAGLKPASSNTLIWRSIRLSYGAQRGHECTARESQRCDYLAYHRLGGTLSIANLAQVKNLPVIGRVAYTYVLRGAPNGVPLSFGRVVRQRACRPCSTESGIPS